ncbi:cyclin-dependent kinase inhibitor 3 isoform X2 [Ascaphus truei]|uniref:cyclin-dependent kinase inhibitor 3 isoform X2 n=1 Tax=Ascaphus truei TaxID=8439 RepID=UPI003F592D6D
MLHMYSTLTQRIVPALVVIMMHSCLLKRDSMQKNEFDSSDEEPTENDNTQFEVSWLSLEPVNCSQFLGICSLPGCKFKDIRRDLQENLEEIKTQGVQDIFVLCTLGELSLYRVPTLLQEYRKQDFIVHHYPFPDGDVPQFDNCTAILEELKACVENNRKTLIHCYGGLGRSCLIAACLLLQVSESVTPQQAISHVRALRGAGAIQTIKQYNYLNEFREKLLQQRSAKDMAGRSISR